MNNHLQQIRTKIMTLDKAVKLCSEWKKKESIVFTNGCFDIIHSGHIHYLSCAADLGNKLIVGLNSDESVSKLKGKDMGMGYNKLCMVGRYWPRWYTDFGSIIIVQTKMEIVNQSIS